MESICDEFKAIASDIKFKAPQIKLLSNVTGDFIKENQITADYWVEHILSAVNFAGCVKSIEQAGCDVFQELGPDSTLIGLAQQSVLNTESQFVSALSRDGNASDWQSILNNIGQLYTQGVEIDWEEYDKPYLRQKVLLPTYPFQRRRFWIDAAPMKQEKSVERSVSNKVVLSGLTVSEGFISLNQDNKNEYNSIEVKSNLDYSQKFDEIRHSELLLMTDSDIVSAVITFLADALLLEQVDVDTLDRNAPFLKLGMDSIVGIELISAVNRYFQIKLAAATLYDHSTVNTLSTHIRQSLLELDDSLKGRVKVSTKLSIISNDVDISRLESIKKDALDFILECEKD